MKIYKLPDETKAIIFDIDSTLYTDSLYAYEQVDCQIRAFALKKGISANEGRKMVSDYRKKYAQENNGKKISLGNTLLAFGVPIEESIKMREDLLEPKDFLCENPELIKILKKIQNSVKMICVTNNPVLPARKTLEAIGISDFFPEIIGLDTCLKSKPAYEPFELALKKLNCKAENCLAVGDRFDMDLSIPLELGMGGVLVNGVEDLMELLNSQFCQ